MNFTPQELPSMDWMVDGACRGYGDSSSVFFPAVKPGQNTLLATLERQAKAVCGLCPVRNICLEHALAHEDFGIWGGTTEEERRKMKRQMWRAGIAPASQPTLFDEVVAS